jgi:hypothetical protein
MNCSFRSFVLSCLVPGGLAFAQTATYSPQSGVTVMAFAGAKNVIVAVNQNTSSKTQTFTVSKGVFANPKRYTTSSSKRLADAGTTTVANGSFTATLDAQSITTWVAEGSTPVVGAPAAKEAPVVREGMLLRARGGKLFLVDLGGRVVRTAAQTNGDAVLDLTGLASGLYLAHAGAVSISVVVSPR